MKKKPTSSELSYKEHIVLASFVYQPLPSWAKGRRAGDIMKVADRVFHSAFKTSPTGKVWIHQVTSTCKGLVKRGYLISPTTVTVKWINPRRPEAGEVTYQSPIFALSETGFAYVLSQMNIHALPTVSRVFKLSKKGTDKNKDDVAKSFRAFSDYPSPSRETHEEFF